jgi:putative nucleotidyltransferase with HDIG domain
MATIQLPVALRVGTETRQNAAFSPMRMNAYFDLTRNLVATNSLTDIYQHIVRGAVEVTGSRLCQLYSLNDNDELVYNASYPKNGYRNHWLVDKPAEPNIKSLCQRALLVEHPLLIRLSEPDLGPSDRDYLTKHHIEMLYLIPLRVESMPVGMIVIGADADSFRDFEREERIWISNMIADQSASAIFRARLSTSISENRLETVLALAKTVEARDEYTGDHSQKIADLAELAALRLGCAQNELVAIRWASLLHDIGKIGIPDDILLKPGPLDEDEWKIMKRHPIIGAEIVLKVSNLSYIADLIYSHHERYDGSGYPKGIEDDQIPLGARILAVVDAYSAMTDGRIYKAAISHRDALCELIKCAGSDFDPQVVDAFIGIFTNKENLVKPFSPNQDSKS